MKRPISMCILAPLTLSWACSDGGESANHATEVDAETDPHAAIEEERADAVTDDQVMGGDSDLFGGMAPSVEVEVPDTGEPEPDVGGDPFESDLIVACESAVAVGENPMIDDFDDLDLEPLVTDNRAGGWYSYTDGTPGALLMMSVVSGSYSGDGGGVLEVIGDAVEEYSGVGVGLRWTETGAERCSYDASLYEGVTFWARGRGAVRVALQNPSVRPIDLGGRCSPDSVCFDSHGADIVLSDEWTNYQLPFDELTQAGWGTAVGAFLPEELFVLEYQFEPGVDYEMWLDELAFYAEGVDPVPMDGGAVVPELDASSPVDVDGGVPAPDAGAPDLEAGSGDGDF